MARRQVLEVTCDRCNKTETQSIDDKADNFAGEELAVTFHGQTVKYGDLCKRCRGACENYFKSMTKQTDEEKKAIEEEETKNVPPGKPQGFLGIGKKAG